ncbi:MAG TPA: type I-E CRISPR-associated protein Cas7/Cse4/CasC [Mycobacteriales bacterium]|nr:type I-E CRISPR-associated protein Cas7/Cse4/CasC [Mycobacteriales bacterium]
MSTRTYIDVHVLQTVPPSNLNRDDAGSPKQAVYGGARRARVSSQAWKRATRKAFADQVPEEELATRTKKILGMVIDRLVARTGVGSEQAARIATSLLARLDIKPGKKRPDETAYLLFFGRPQLEHIVALVADRAAELAGMSDEDLAEAVKNLPVREQLGTGHPIDVALFGRMVADIPGLNVDAATQVAHALSTHAVEIEFDYYTAVDDENPDEETGAGMIGTVEFNSATLYRFATVGLHQLVDNLGGDAEATATALEVFLTAFVKSMPTGHQNSFAHRTPPYLVSVVIREDQPVNLVSAFESPVRPNGDGIAALSAARLVAELRRTGELWDLAPLQVASAYTLPDRDADTAREVLGEPMPLADVVAATVRTARQRLTGAAPAEVPA